MIPSLPRPVRLALLPLGILWALGAEWTRLQAGWPASWALTDLLPGLGFLVAGQLAWERRPDNRTGPLMVAVGFAWFVGTYGAWPDVGRVAHAFQGYYDALLAWLVLAYPTGRLRGTAARFVVGAWFALLMLRSGFRLVANRPSTDYDLANPTEVDRYVRDIAFRDAGDAIFLALIAGLAFVVVVLIVRRLATDTDVGRRVAAPILLGGVALGLGVVVEVLALSSAGSFAERTIAWDIGQGLTNVTGALVAIGFAVGLARARLARATVADLVIELGETPERPVLRDVLARALHDPSLEIAYPVPGTDRYVDASGQSVSLPSTTDPARGLTRLERGSTTVAVFIHDPALAEQRELVHSVAAATRLAIENEQLAAEVRTQLEAVRASRARIVAAGDAERRRVERDLHDGAQQRLVTLALALQIARGKVDPASADLGAALEQASRELELALAELRELARGLHPAVLTEEGLAAAVELLVDRTPVPVTVRASSERFPAEVEAAAYFVVAEALTNVIKYAHATSVDLAIEHRDGTLTVEVTDNGVGGADPSAGSGLRGLDDRVAAVGGVLEVVSKPNHGTVVRAEIPCA